MHWPYGQARQRQDAILGYAFDRAAIEAAAIMPAPTIPAECAMWSWLAMNAPEEMPETEPRPGRPGNDPADRPPRHRRRTKAAASSSAMTIYCLMDMAYRSGMRGRLWDRMVQRRLELVQSGHHSRLQDIGYFGAAARRHLRKDVRVCLIFEDRGLECVDLVAGRPPGCLERSRPRARSPSGAGSPQ